MYWDSTGDWRLTYYSDLSNKDESKLTKVEKSERDLDRLEKRLTYELLKSTSNSKLLDIGCGVGRQILEFSERYPSKNFVGVDISKYQIELLTKIITENQVQNVTGITMDAAEISDIGEEFDIITFFNNSFGCMDSRQQICCLNSFDKILASRGFLLISCFDRMELIEESYKEWKLPPVSIDYSNGIVDLGEYKSNWKCADIIIPYFGKHSEIYCSYKEQAGLGTVYIFQRGG